MSLLDEIASTNDAQIAAIDAELEALHSRYLAARAELRTARSILVGRRKRLAKELSNGQAGLPFEPASAVVTEPLDQARISAVLGSTMRPARGGFGPAGAPALADQYVESKAVADHLAQAEREAEGEDDADAMHAAHPVFTPPDPDAEPRLRRRKGVAGG